MCSGGRSTDILERRRPRHVFLENVDRLLKSPTSHRGRDFAIILACLSDLGYLVEWRVVNAAEYGFPQRRKRVFIVAHQDAEAVLAWTRPPRSSTEGVLATRIARVAGRRPGSCASTCPTSMLRRTRTRSRSIGRACRITPFRESGVMWQGRVWTRTVKPTTTAKFLTLGDVLVPDDEVPESFFIPDEQLSRWEYLKGAKSEDRVAENGHATATKRAASRTPTRPTALTHDPNREGGRSPSRFKHVIETDDGRLRRLTPIELERLNGFPDDWTNTECPTPGGPS